MLPLLLGAVTSLSAMCAGSVLLLRTSRGSKLLAGRIEQVVTPHGRAGAGVERPGAAAAARRSEQTGAQAIGAAGLARFERLFGCTPSCREASSLRWWIVLPVALVISRAVLELLVAVVGPLAAFATPVLWVMFSRMWWKRAEQKRRAALYTQFPDTLGMLVRAVRVGIPVSEAIRSAAREQPAPTSHVLAALSDQLSVGIPLDEALKAMADQCGLSEYRFFATALTLQAQTGGGLTETLENLADVIRKRLALRARAHALAGEARMSAAIIGILPIVAGIALLVLNPEYISLLITDPTGNTILAVAILMMGCGIMSMRAIIRKSLS